MYLDGGVAMLNRIGFRASLLFAFLTCCLSVIASPYTVNPGDMLRIDVWNEDSLSQEVLVRPDGKISLPMAGEIDTSAATPEQVADKIAAALQKYMKDPPRVVVSLASVSGNKIYVIGKVIRPGEYVITSDTDVIQALALAGGLNPFAAQNDIRILRRSRDGNQVAIPFRYSKVESGEDLASNIILNSRDVVVVP
ncbi:polysaccharide biosynthesis/export family protein [Haliea sp. E17]|uniref:polysaccharide biosynthesis/export family protein n=1 Tax=Haliea sp. E17 TaxID=3401576 RepID=UPI003AAE5FFB